MTYGYIRVSTDKQTVENQRFEISRFCEQQNLLIDGWIEETIKKMNIEASFAEAWKQVKREEAEND